MKGNVALGSKHEIHYIIFNSENFSNIYENVFPQSISQGLA